MMSLKVDATDMLKWARYFEEIPRQTKRALAHSMNTYGEGAVEQIVRSISEKNSWDPDEVRSRIMVKEATPNNLNWELDSSMVVPGSQDWSRPWQQRDQSNFEQNTLVKIVTMDDGWDCDVCRQIAAASPYTMSEVLQMQAKWAGYVPPTPNIHPGVITNLVHPRCRCLTQSWSSSRRLEVSSFQGESGSIGSAPQELFTTKQLGRHFVSELSTEMNKMRLAIK
jgi:hypothetical protein